MLRDEERKVDKLEEQGNGEKREEYECGCGKKFSSSRNLKRHRDDKHRGGIPKMYECDICGSKYTSKGNVSRHKSEHRVVVPKVYECECGNMQPKGTYLCI
jgi:uncharacterized Zn-finger protein